MINSNFKLGKLPAIHDARTLHLENYYTFPDPPEETIWSNKVKDYEMLGNDTAGNCGPVAGLHQIQTWTANAQNEVRFTTQQAIELYSQFTGYNPASGLNDSGIVLLKMLTYWRKYGFYGHKIGAFMSVNPRNLRMVRIAINEFGGTINGYNLPISAQNQPRWDISASFNGDGAPGSWGGHCTIHVDALNNGDFNNVTWGTLIPSSEKFVMVYCDEMYVLLSEDFINDKKMSPSNFNWDKMVEDLNHII